MELMDAIRNRRSIRVFDGRPVDAETVRALVQAATFAPSRMNSQPWHFHVATEGALRRVTEVMAMSTSYLEEYIDALGPDGIERAARFYADLGNAPVVIAISSPYYEDPSEARDEAISTGAALENLLLAACDAGLGACSLSVPHWIADRLAAAFEVPSDREIVSLVVLGHPDETPVPKDRHTDVVTFLS